MRRYEVNVEPGAELADEEFETAELAGPTGPRVKGPFVAETFPVTSEGEYLVVEIVALMP